MTALLALALGATLRLTPTDDLWIYPHAGDPQKDPYLRVWGDGERAVSKDAEEASRLSYSFLSFDVSTVPVDGRLKTACLVLTHMADPKFSEALAKSNPIEARTISNGFSEKTWTYASLPKFTPGLSKDSIFGTGEIRSWPETGKEFKIELNLLAGAGKFADVLAESRRTNKPLAMALTSKIAVTATEGIQTMYKFYSKDDRMVSSRPVLVLEFE